MSATNQFVALGDHNLIPLSPYVLTWVYGDDDYVRSVFGTLDITRQDIEFYYQKAKSKWTTIGSSCVESWRIPIGAWLRENNIKGLDFYFPFGQETLWFKQEQDAFMFKLKFGEITKPYHNEKNKIK
jgi:hypothetical protein